MSKDSPLVSITIVVINGLEYLKKCLKSIFESTYKNIEITIIDNASTDGTKEYLKNNYPNINFIENHKNIGFAPAQNKGMRIAKGKYILPVNPDIIMTDTYIEKLVEAAETNEKVGSVAGKLLLNSNTIDTTGHILTIFHRPLNRGHGEIDWGQYDRKEYIFGVCGAAPLYRKAMLDDIALFGEYFDESYHTSYEDVDLDWRAQIRGWKCLYNPEAVAYHKRTATGWSDNKYFQCHEFKNQYLMRIKNEQFINIFLHLPFIIVGELDMLICSIRRPHVIKGILWMLPLLPLTLKKRKIIQKNKKVSNTYLRGLFTISHTEIAALANFLIVISAVALLIYLLGWIKFLMAVLIVYLGVGGISHLLLSALFLRPKNKLA